MRDIYRDMAERTGGDIYIAVAGPVRTGKSTFIKRFSELLLLPNMENEYEKERLTDELPQSGAGRSIMTTQPRFVPAEAVNVTFEEGVSCLCKLIYCVGYMVPGTWSPGPWATERGMDLVWSPLPGSITTSPFPRRRRWVPRGSSRSMPPSPSS